MLRDFRAGVVLGGEPFIFIVLFGVCIFYIISIFVCVCILSFY